MADQLEYDGIDRILERVRIEYMEINADSINTWREVFGTENGKEVLAKLLTILGHFSTSNASAAESALENIAKLILAEIGVWHAEQLRSTTRAYLEIPPRIPSYNRPKTQE
jgi:hypothetical protein